MRKCEKGKVETVNVPEAAQCARVNLTWVLPAAMARQAGLAVVVLLAASLALARAEYVWTGTEWKWQEPETGAGAGGLSLDTGGGGFSSQGSDFSSHIEEGSGNSDWDDDDEDYDDYTYPDFDKPSRKKNKDDRKKTAWDQGSRKNNKKNKNKNRNRNSEILPATDDEDLFEGSGGDFDVPRSQYPEVSSSNNNNYDTYNPVTQPPAVNNNNNNIYVDNDDEYDEYDDEYDDYNYDEDDYDDEDEDDIDDIGFVTPDLTNHGVNVVGMTTAKPSDTVINMNNANNNVWNTPGAGAGTTPRTRTTPGTGGGADTVHRTVPVNRPASFFAQPGILAAVIGGAVVGLLCAILLVMFIVYRMRKKDEGSYALDEPKRSHNVNSYSKPPNREFYA